MAISFEDAKALLEKGQISSKTFDSITGVKWEKKAAGGMLAAAGEAVKAISDKIPSIGGTAQGINESGQSTQNVNVETATPVDQQTGEARQNVIQQQEQVNKSLENIGQTQQEVMDPYVEEQAGKLKGLQEAIVKNEIDVQAQMAEGEKNLAESQKFLANATDKARIDPDRYMNNLTPGSKVMTSIGLALSGMGSGLTGQQNMAMNTLQTNIERDIKAQQTNYEMAFKNAQMKGAIGTQQISGAQTRAMARSISTIQTISAYNAGLENIMQNITSKTALDKAELLKQQSMQTLQRELLNFENLFKTNISAGNGQTNKLFLDMFNNAMNGRPITAETGAKDVISSKVKGLPTQTKETPVQPAQAKPAESKPAEQPKEEPKKKSFLESMMGGIGKAP